MEIEKRGRGLADIFALQAAIFTRSFKYSSFQIQFIFVYILRLFKLTGESQGYGSSSCVLFEFHGCRDFLRFSFFGTDN